MGELVKPQHIHHPNRWEGRREEIGPLGHAGSH